jgi:hypothetical protein
MMTRPGSVQALIAGRMQSMSAPKKYSDELRERATRMALDAIAVEG